MPFERTFANIMRSALRDYGYGVMTPATRTRGQTDRYHFDVTLPAGRVLRIHVVTLLSGAQRSELSTQLRDAPFLLQESGMRPTPSVEGARREAPRARPVLLRRLPCPGDAPGWPRDRHALREQPLAS